MFRKKWKKTVVSVLLIAAMALGSTGCGKAKKDPKPTPKPTAEVDEGNATASGKGGDKADLPLLIGCTSFQKKFNPFITSNAMDKRAVDLTQIYLVTHDRSNNIVYKGIDGEMRKFRDKDYTYFGASDVDMQYDREKDTTSYQITLRDDLRFSDGEKVTIDDVIFTMYVLCDKKYKGNYILKDMPIRGLLRYRKTKKAKSISGIKRIDDYTMKITTEGYDRRMIYALEIPIAPLHYYGDTSKFNVKKKRFGFKKGDISSVVANKTSPIGAGAYRFVKYEDDVIYYTANELYHMGTPKTAFVQLVDMSKNLEETKKNIANKSKDTDKQAQADAETVENEQEDSVLSQIPEVTEIKAKSVDVIDAKLGGEDWQWVMQENSNGEISGNTLESRLVSDGIYHYIGMNAQKISVAGKPKSWKSLYLRRGLGTIFAACRTKLMEEYQASVELAQYPMTSDSWVVPDTTQENYKEAYSKDASGADIYEDDMGNEERLEAAKKAAITYFEKAGYTIEDGKVVKAPKKASLAFEILLAKGEQHPLYAYIKAVADTLQELGITLQIRNVTKEATLQKMLEKNQAAIWAGTRKAADNDLLARYGSRKITGKSNPFAIEDIALDKKAKQLEQMMKHGERKQNYAFCFSKVMNWAVEVPVCQMQKVTFFSSSRIKSSSLAGDITIYYDWMRDIHKVAMK